MTKAQWEDAGEDTVQLRIDAEVGVTVEEQIERHSAKVFKNKDEGKDGHRDEKGK